MLAVQVGMPERPLILTWQQSLTKNRPLPANRRRRLIKAFTDHRQYISSLRHHRSGLDSLITKKHRSQQPLQLLLLLSLLTRLPETQWASTPSTASSFASPWKIWYSFLHPTNDNPRRFCIFLCNMVNYKRVGLTNRKYCYILEHVTPNKERLQVFNEALLNKVLQGILKFSKNVCICIGNSANSMLQKSKMMITTMMKAKTIIFRTHCLKIW